MRDWGAAPPIPIIRRSRSSSGISMTEFQRIVVVIDPTAATQPGLDRGTRLARQLRAKLELFICDYDSSLMESRALDAGAIAKARAARLDAHLRRLRELAAPLTAAGLHGPGAAR